ncbi:hypothetical protein Sango_2818900 [Sesamum angolense]|uniref:Endonuclease/exonuclease/phosphatase domain-containing protein n=1 Tax=Sesamum angolense TaxID=2727404 RepID=A0AAE1T6C9_9LAMI|nr:hypothetical protein Sango_2818900 [Sesamum angolense]
MVDQPLRSEVAIGASTVTDLAAGETTEFLHRVNSAELTQPLHAVQEQSEKQIPVPNSLKKSFAEAVSRLAGNRSLHQLPSDLRKYFLADHAPQPFGVKSVNHGRPTLSFADAETEELAAPYRFSLIEKFSHRAPPYSQMHQLIARLGIQGVFTVSMINKVIFEQFPEYCSLCKHVGHKDSDCFSKVNAPKPPPRNKIIPRLQRFAGTEMKQARDKGQKVTESVGRPVASQNSERSKAEAEYSKDNHPEKRDKGQQVNGNQVEQIQSHGKQRNLEIDNTGTTTRLSPNSETDQGAAILESTSYTTLKAQGENYRNNMDSFTLDDPLMAELLDRDWEAEKNIDSNSKTTFHNKEGQQVNNSNRNQNPVKRKCSNRRQRNKLLRRWISSRFKPPWKLVKLRLGTSKKVVTKRRQSLQSSTDFKAWKAVTHFWSLTLSSRLYLILQTQHPAITFMIKEHILEDSIISNRLKRNNSMEDNSIKTGKAAGKGKKNKGNSATRTLPKRHIRNPRRALWEELKRLSLDKVPWIVGGDFNTMLHTHENRGGTISSLGSIEDFNDMVLDSGLTDAGFEGEPFTWSNKRVWRRLDRALYSQEWAELFNSTRVSHLPRRLSDHHPLLISTTRTEDKVPSSFRFQHMWIMHPNFQDMIKQS